MDMETPKKKSYRVIKKDLFGVAEKCRFCRSDKSLKLLTVDLEKSPVFSVISYWREAQFISTVHACRKCAGIFEAINKYFLLHQRKASTSNPTFCAICEDKKRNMAQYANSDLIRKSVLKHLNIQINKSSKLFYCNTCVIRLDQLNRLFVKMVEATGGVLDQEFLKLGALKSKLIVKKPGVSFDDSFKVTPKKKPARKFVPTASVRAVRVQKEEEKKSKVLGRAAESRKDKPKRQSRVSGRPAESRKSAKFPTAFGKRPITKKSLPRVSVARKSMVFRPSTHQVEPARTRYPRAAAAPKPKPQVPRRITRLALRELGQTLA